MPIRYGHEGRGRAQAGARVDLRPTGGRPWRGVYPAGCDGGRSTVREAAGIGLPGRNPTVGNVVAEAEVTGEPERGIRRDACGTHASSGPEDGGPVRVLVAERRPDVGEPALQDLGEALVAV